MGYYMRISMIEARMTRVRLPQAPGMGSGRKGDSAEAGRLVPWLPLPGRGRRFHGLSPFFRAERCL